MARVYKWVKINKFISVISLSIITLMIINFMLIAQFIKVLSTF